MRSSVPRRLPGQPLGTGPPGLDELGPEEKNLRRIIHPDQEDHQGAGCPIRRGRAGVGQVQADQGLAGGETARAEITAP